MTDLTRVTVNLTPAAVRAVEQLGGGLTEQINTALRLAAAVRVLAAEDGSVTVIGPGRSRTRIYVL